MCHKKDILVHIQPTVLYTNIYFQIESSRACSAHITLCVYIRRTVTKIGCFSYIHAYMIVTSRLNHRTHEVSNALGVVYHSSQQTYTWVLHTNFIFLLKLFLHLINSTTPARISFVYDVVAVESIMCYVFVDKFIHTTKCWT